MAYENIPESIKNKDRWFAYEDNLRRKSKRDIIHMSKDKDTLVDRSDDSGITLGNH